MDVAYPPDAVDRLETFQELTGGAVHPIFRTDPLVDRLIGEEAGTAEIVDAVTSAMADAASRGHVGFKTIMAYRTGLAVDPGATERDAEQSLRGRDVPVRRRAKALRDVVIRRALGTASELGLPFQFHTGFGDSEIRLAESNPLLLEELLRSPEGSACRVDLIHGGFPWHEEVAFLAATKPNVWIDVSLFDIFSPATVADRLVRLVDLAPVHRILMGTDGFHEPELYWFAGRVLLDAWSVASERLRGAGAREGWLADAAARMFEGNAKELYGI
jgi:predicted TIM-barrel fold metal-dependent hydrolase